MRDTMAVGVGLRDMGTHSPNWLWFEEPVSPEERPGLSEVRHSTTTPIATGEREFIRLLIEEPFLHRAMAIEQPDIARAAGFTEIRRISAGDLQYM